MHRIGFAVGLCGLLLACPRLDGRQDENGAGNRQAGRSGGIAGARQDGVRGGQGIRSRDGTLT